MNEGGMAVLETALCLIFFVFIVLATAALFFFLFNQQIVEHAVYSNAAKIRSVPYQISTRDGDISYRLVTDELERSINTAADSLLRALTTELVGVQENTLTVQVGYLQLAQQMGTPSVSRHGATTRGNPHYAHPLNDLSADRLAQTLGETYATDNSGPAPVLLRVRVYLKTEPFTRFDILRVCPPAIEFDVMVPLRQQAGILAHRDALPHDNQRRIT